MPLFVILFAALLPSESFLQDSTALRLEEVTVTATAHSRRQTETSNSSVLLTSQYLSQHLQPSLAMSLSETAGVQASAIGSAQSRPAVRGMGFNRLLVIHDGIRHEGQQWGEDHGLEIDRFAIEHIDILKGPAALLYGSDAIAGALVLSSYARPEKNIGGAIRLFMQTNNMLFGTSAMLEGKTKRFYWHLNATYQDYGDMQVPTDSIEYYSYRIPLYKRTLRNTAGREVDGSLTLGYAGYRWHQCVKIYETFSTSGFFANAHGLEVRLSNIDYDRSRRDIDLPRQQVNHLKVLSHTVYNADNWSFEANLAWQHNLREEHSEPISHGYMPTPDGTLERAFSKHTASANFSTRWQVRENYTLRFGLSGELQRNRRSGWGFVIPDFETYSTGLYAAQYWRVNKSLTLNAGIRYDYAHTDIHAYQDWYPTPENGALVYKERSEEQKRDFHSLTWAVGMNFTHKGWKLKTNIGKGFRVPIAKELGADGVNYHIFRYEKGNSALQPEKSYQLDLSVGWGNKQVCLQVDPFVGWFPNYIFLTPTAYYYEGLQVYHYTQCQVLRTGFEVQGSYSPLSWLELLLQADYLFARQLTGEKAGYGLPFSPPWRIMPEVKFKWRGKQENTRIGDGYASLKTRITGAQRDIVPPEKPTDGWWTLNLRAGQQFVLPSCSFSLSVNAENILNRKYYDHTSFYRLIDVPEAGWNLSVMLSVDF